MTTIGKVKAMWRRRTPVFLLALTAVVFSGIGGVSADEYGNNFLLDRSFYLAVGGFFPSIDSEVKLNPERVGSGAGTTIDLENTFGLDESSESLWVQLRWRFARRHFFEFEGISLPRNGNQTAQQSFTIGDTTANFGASLDSEFNVTIGRFTYGWLFVKDERKEAALLVGAHFAKGELSALLSGNIEDANTGASLSGTIVEEGEDFAFPLPHVGVNFAYAFSPRLVVDTSALFFYLEIGDVKGSLLELQANVNYLLWQNFALGAGLRYLDVIVKDDKTNGTDEYDFSYLGPVVFLSASF